MFKLRILLSASLVFFITSCKDSDYEKVQAENQVLSKQLEEERFAAPKLLQEAKAFLSAGDPNMAEEKIKLLLNRHNDKQEAIEGKKISDEIVKLKTKQAESSVWDKALGSDDLSFTQFYIEQYGNGEFIKEAKARLKHLKIEKEKSDYENALQQNSSELWKAFLVNYPNRDDQNNIQKRIIQAEVDEIMRNTKTGELPTSQKTSYSYTSTSLINIKNDTECQLTIRYSGSDVKMIEIPSGGTRSISLASGTYKIAASACGLHYAGTEDLGGNYTSSYYIVSSRY